MEKRTTKYQTKSLIVPEYILPFPFTPTLGPPTQSQALSTRNAKSTDDGVDNGCLTEWADGWLCACVGVGEIGGWVLPSVGG